MKKDPRGRASYVHVTATQARGRKADVVIFLSSVTKNDYLDALSIIETLNHK